MSELQEILNAKAYFHALGHVAARLRLELIDAIASVLIEKHTSGHSVFLFGNGGSASLASHFACDLGKGTIASPRVSRGLRAIALTDNVPVLTAWANDSSYEDVFAEQLENFVRPGDVAFAISCSGNSPNILKALHVARENRAMTIGFGGFEGGKMKSLCDICVVVPSENMQVIEDMHLSAAHAVTTIVKNRILTSALGKTTAHATAT